MLGLGAVISPKAQSSAKHGCLQTHGSTGSYLSIPITNSLFRGNHTISFWIKLPQSTFSSVHMGFRNANKALRSDYFVYLTQEHIRYTHTATGTSYSETESDLYKSDGRSTKWYHIVLQQATLGSANPQFIIFVNGNLKTIGSYSYAMTQPNRLGFSPASSFIFGGLNITSDATISPRANTVNSIRVANFSAWNATLSSQAVSVLYNNGRGVKLHKDKGNYTNSANLILNYNFNSPSQDGTYRSTGSSKEVATAVGCKHVADHPFVTKSERLQG